MRTEAKLERVLREQAGAQHGLVTREQLLAAGIPDHVIERRVRNGRLLPIHRGVYQAGPVVGSCAREMAAVLACGRESRLSHGSAGVLWELRARVSSDESIELTIPRRDRRRISGIIVHRVSRLEPDEVTIVNGIPVTTPARTLLDLGECVGLRELEQALARTERKGLVTRDDVRAMVDRHPRHRGARALRRLVENDGPAPFTRSPAEEIMLALVRKSGLPAPELNALLLRYEVDFLWRVQRLVVEVDGIAYHGSARAFVQDRRRDAQLIAAGYRVVRFTWKDLTEQPEATLVHIAQALVHHADSA